MNIILSVYHLLASLAILMTGCGVIIKLYAKSLKREMKETCSTEISVARSSIEKKKDLEIRDIKQKFDSDLSELKKNVKSDHEKLETIISKETNPEVIKNKVEGEFKLIGQEFKQLKDMMLDMKTIMSNQQETLIAIQMNITELKPRLDHLEARVTSIESKQSK